MIMSDFFCKMRLGFSCILALFTLFSCKKPAVKPAPIFALGTVCTVDAFEDGTKDLYDKIAFRLQEIDALFSANRTNSLINKINDNAGIAPINLGDSEVAFVLKRSLYFAKISNGDFDPTIGSLVKLWGIATDKEQVPLTPEIKAAQAKVDYRCLLLEDTKDGTSAYLTRSGMRLDLGAIAKGYAADCVVKILEENKVVRAVVDLGGNIYVYGKKQDKTPWRVGIKDPTHPAQDIVASLDIEGGSLVTSGVYERFFIKDGIRYHHIIDPKTGFPCDTGLVSVTVCAKDSIDCDALSTLLFIKGENAIDFIKENLDESKVQVVLITKDNHIKYSKSLAQNITIYSSDFIVDSPF